ncbi:PREDICTED: uncharacterized protein LOC104734328 [Camelina sativa]|uniref:Uncharacterized protein LOC104734328 n=1 Tax=Camelina sativa TaxID=90675 RepID=A0ABM0V7M5_CAMSA|nr:PREDICTED: uncharacterized protein LOC104734328 [Camelina sativa]XP_010452177.1 PREDICTED: uncharacterized protein LOC104734328 [Camelina sativa]
MELTSEDGLQSLSLQPYRSMMMLILFLTLILVIPRLGLKNTGSSLPDMTIRFLRLISRWHSVDISLHVEISGELMFSLTDITMQGEGCVEKAVELNGSIMGERTLVVKPGATRGRWRTTNSDGESQPMGCLPSRRTMNEKMKEKEKAKMREMKMKVKVEREMKK